MTIQASTNLSPDIAIADLSVEAAVKPSLKARFRRLVLVSAATLFPRQTANKLARRYLCSAHGYSGDLARLKKPVETLEIGPDTYILRHNPTAEASGKRILIVPGHDGHYLQFARMIRGLQKTGALVDVLVLPGHMQPFEEICGLGAIVEAIRCADRTQGHYDGLLTHCVSANAVLFALEEGLVAPRVALVSTPLDLPDLIRFGGQQYGIEGRCLDLFQERIDQLSAPYPTSRPWQTVAKHYEGSLLFVHARDDYAAPVSVLENSQPMWKDALIEVFDKGNHNSILNLHPAIKSVVSYLT